MLRRRFQTPRAARVLLVLHSLRARCSAAVPRRRAPPLLPYTHRAEVAAAPFVSAPPIRAQVRGARSEEERRSCLARGCAAPRLPILGFAPLVAKRASLAGSGHSPDRRRRRLWSLLPSPSLEFTQPPRARVGVCPRQDPATPTTFNDSSRRRSVTRGSALSQ